MTIGELYAKLEELYPCSLRCPWDNDGLMLCPDPARPVERVMLALDATGAALDAAARADCSLLLTHHPLLFRPLRSLHPGTLAGRRVVCAWQKNVSVLSLHTRLDAGEGGVNDALLRILGLKRCGVFGDAESPSIGRIAELAEPLSAHAFAEHVRKSLGCTAVSLTGDRPVRRIAVLGGDGKDLISSAMEAGADTFVTGAAGYNAALDAAESGMNVIEAGHYHTEAPVLPHLAALCREFADAECVIYDSNLTSTLV